MADDIHEFPGLKMANTPETELPTGPTPDEVLEGAKGEYEKVFVIGFKEDGVLSARLSEGMNHVPELLWMLDQFKFDVMLSTLTDGDEDA